jgi:hypothetical protein
MLSPVKLDAIIEGMESQSDEIISYLNKKTSEVIIISDEEFSAAEFEEPMEDFPEWQQEQIKIAKEILETDDYIALPDKYEIDEYHIMERFCLSINDDKIRDILYSGIKGRGAFRIFKDNIRRYGLVDEWYKFRDEALKQIAIEWCECHEIPFTEQ